MIPGIQTERTAVQSVAPSTATTIRVIPAKNQLRAADLFGELEKNPHERCDHQNDEADIDQRMRPGVPRTHGAIDEREDEAGDEARGARRHPRRQPPAEQLVRFLHLRK